MLVLDDTRAKVYQGDSEFELGELASESIDSMVTDPPAGIAFMHGKTSGWDAPSTWKYPITSHGFKDDPGKFRNPAPSIGQSTRNPVCQVCHKHKRGKKRCQCEEPEFDEREHARSDRDIFIAKMTAIFKECLRVLKPGGHAAVWAIPRTAHWTAMALEEAGFEVRDCISHLKDNSAELASFFESLSPSQREMWMRAEPTNGLMLHVNGSGFPKGRNISKEIDAQYGRIRSSVKQVKQSLREKFDASGKTRTQIDKECGFRASNYLSVEDDTKRDDPWFNVLPSPEKWLVLKKVLGLEDETVSAQLDQWFKQAERELVGWKKTGPGIPFSTAGGPTELPITESQTPEGKQWKGWNVALKPSVEHWLLVRKPLCEGTIVAQVLATGTGALNIDACRVKGGAGYEEEVAKNMASFKKLHEKTPGWKNSSEFAPDVDGAMLGRWPSNLLLSHTQRVMCQPRPDLSADVKATLWAYFESEPTEELEVRQEAIPLGWRQLFLPVRIEGCKHVGTKIVRAPVINRFVDGMRPFGEGAGHKYTQTGGGVESQAVTDCKPPCPVPVLDNQSGDRKSHDTADTGGFRESMRDPSWLKSGTQPSLPPGRGDTGGASRFFPVLCAPETLDNQSGETRSAYPGNPQVASAYNARDKSDQKSPKDVIFGGKTPGKVYGDTGSVSRYFPVFSCAAGSLDDQSGERRGGGPVYTANQGKGYWAGGMTGVATPFSREADDGGASRFFPTFTCAPDTLDKQTGERTSTLTGKADPSRAHTNPGQTSKEYLWGNIGHEASTHVYADSGGGSRFFPTFSPDCALHILDMQSGDLTPHAHREGYTPRLDTGVYNPGRKGSQSVWGGVARGGASQFYPSFSPECALEVQNLQSGDLRGNTGGSGGVSSIFGGLDASKTTYKAYGDHGGAARFFPSFEPECVPSLIDAQSGETVSSPRTGDDAGTAMDKTREGWRFKRANGGFSDSGGGSRFFPSFEPDCPLNVNDVQSGVSVSRAGGVAGGEIFGSATGFVPRKGQNDSGGGGRFFPSFEPDPTLPPFYYTPKASTADRILPDGSKSPHPTVKSHALMSWLIKLVTPPGGVVLDPFSGSGSTLVSAVKLGFRAVGIEQDETYIGVIRQRLAAALAESTDNVASRAAMDLMHDIE